MRILNKTLVLIILTILSYSNAFSQNQERTIHIMRAKQFYGSGASMDIHINGQSISKLKSGNRLMLKTSTLDTLNVQIVYPLGKKHKSKIVTVLPSDYGDTFINAYYWGTGFNPTMFYTHEQPEFNIHLEKLDPQKAKGMFLNDELYKDKAGSILIKYY